GGGSERQRRVGGRSPRRGARSSRPGCPQRWSSQREWRPCSGSGTRLMLTTSIPMILFNPLGAAQRLIRVLNRGKIRAIGGQSVLPRLVALVPRRLAASGEVLPHRPPSQIPLVVTQAALKDTSARPCGQGLDARTWPAER